MYIRRDYSQPFFGAGGRRRGSSKRLLAVLLVLVGLALATLTQLNTLQEMALEALGMAPAPTALPGELATDAMSAYVVGDLQRASELFSQALAQRPDSVDFLYEYGLILIEMEQYDAAIAHGDRAINANSFDPRGYALKARALVWAGRSSEALPVALSGLEVDRRFAPLYAVIARAYVALGNIPAAIENAEMAVELDTLSADARRSYAYALSAAAARDEALNQLRLAVSIEPGNVQAAMELAFQYLARDMDQEAIDLYLDVLRLQPRNARAMLRLCAAYRKTGQFLTALDSCEQAVAADPNYAPAHFRLGMIQYTDRNYAQAQAAFAACVSLQPDNIECKYRLGLAHFYLNDCDSGWRILNESLTQAQAQNIGGDTLTNIRLGLSEISRNCPAYRGRVTEPTSTPDPERGPQPLIGLTPVVVDLTDPGNAGDGEGAGDVSP